jgi:hypothetical protein
VGVLGSVTEASLAWVLGGGWFGGGARRRVQAGAARGLPLTAGRRPFKWGGSHQTRACDCRGAREVPDLGRHARQGARLGERQPDHRSIACTYGSSGTRRSRRAGHRKACCGLGKARDDLGIVRRRGRKPRRGRRCGLALWRAGAPEFIRTSLVQAKFSPKF